MKPKTPRLDINKLSPEQRDKLDTWNTGQSQLQTLEDIASMAQEMLGIMDDNQKDPGRKTLIIDHVTGDDFVKILQNMQDSLQAFKEQKEPTMPDYATPVVEAVNKLETAVAASMKGKDAKPVVNVEAPNVNVAPTPVDFSGVERILKNDLPKAFRESISLIPTIDIPEQDDTAVLEKLTEAITLLGDIDTGVRMKPQPGTMKVTNPDGTPVYTSPASVISTKNSNTVNLAANGVFTGLGEDVTTYSEVRITVFASHASATDGLSIQQSSNGSNWDVTDTYTVAATTGKTFSVPRQAKYFRIVYTNGASALTSFRLQTILNRGSSASSSQRASDAYTNETDLVQSQTFGMVWNGSTWDRMPGSTAGVTIGTITPGTSATSLGKAEDSVHVNGDTGVAILGIRDDTLNATSGTEGDYEMIHTTAEGAVWVTQAPSITNGWSTFNATSGDGSTALTATAQQVKATTGTVGGWYIYNPNSAATYVNFYNATSASVTVGTTNQQMVIVIPATSGANVEFGNGITFATAISISATTTGGGNTAPSTALEANVFYK